jgi:hypothetical protein
MWRLVMIHALYLTRIHLTRMHLTRMHLTRMPTDPISFAQHSLNCAVQMPVFDRGDDAGVVECTR